MSALLDKLFDILNPQPIPASNIIEDLNQKVLDVKNDIQVSRTQLTSFFEKMLGCEYGGIIQEVATAEGGKFYDDNITSKLYIYKDLLKTDIPVDGPFTGLEVDWIPFDLVNQKVYSYVTLFNNDNTDVGGILTNLISAVNQLVADMNTLEIDTVNKLKEVVPIGTVLVGYFPEEITLPGIYIDADGSILDKTEFPEAFEIFGYNYGGFGDNFRILDLRGEFIRILDRGRGVDPARLLGSFQEHQILKHKHNGVTTVNGNHQHISTWGEHGAFSIYGTAGGGGPGSSSGGDWDNPRPYTSVAGDHSHILVIDETGGLENRSRNIALRAIIRVG